MEMSLGFLNGDEGMVALMLIDDEVLQLEQLQGEVEHIGDAEACVCNIPFPAIDKNTQRADKTVGV